MDPFPHSELKKLQKKDPCFSFNVFTDSLNKKDKNATETQQLFLRSLKKMLTTKYYSSYVISIHPCFMWYKDFIKQTKTLN